MGPAQHGAIIIMPTMGRPLPKQVAEAAGDEGVKEVKQS